MRKAILKQPATNLLLIATNALLTAFVSVFPTAAAPQDLEAGSSKSGRAESFVRAQMSQRQIPAVSFAVVQAGEIVDIASLGNASIELNVPATTRTVYQVASVTKTVTAVAIMRLAENGDFSLDDRIGTHLEGLPADWQSVNVRQLLQHTSGLPDMSIDQFTMDTIASTRSEVLDLLANEPMMFEPGSQWSYNGTNFLLLDMLIETKSGLPYTEFVVERVLAPHGVDSAAFGGVGEVVPDRATHYTWFEFGEGRPNQASERKVLDFSLDPVGYAGGGLNISIEDFAAYMSSLQRGDVISRNSLEAIREPVVLSNGDVFQQPEGAPWSTYGLGWVIDQRGEYLWAGGTGGLRSAFAWYPENDLITIVLTNLQGSRPEALVEGLAEIFRE